jgi:hypothetical protein
MAIIGSYHRAKEALAMLHAKQASKRKRRSKAVPVLGAAGLLSLVGGASTQAAGPAAYIPARQGRVCDLVNDGDVDSLNSTIPAAARSNETLSRALQD